MSCDKELTWGQKKLASISHLQDYQIIQRTFIEASPIIMFLKCPAVNVKICKPSDFGHLLF